MLTCAAGSGPTCREPAMYAAHCDKSISNTDADPPGVRCSACAFSLHQRLCSRARGHSIPQAGRACCRIFALCAREGARQRGFAGRGGDVGGGPRRQPLRSRPAAAARGPGPLGPAGAAAPGGHAGPAQPCSRCRQCCCSIRYSGGNERPGVLGARGARRMALLKTPEHVVCHPSVLRMPHSCWCVRRGLLRSSVVESIWSLCGLCQQHGRMLKCLPNACQASHTLCTRVLV